MGPDVVVRCHYVLKSHGVLLDLLSTRYFVITKDAFNTLIKNLKEKNPIWSKTTLDCERSVTRTLFLEENSDGDRLN